MPGTVDPPVWIDGAHNEDKLLAVTREAIRLFSGGPPPVIVFGMLRSKDPSPILAKLGSAASSIVLTEPSVHGRESLAAGRPRWRRECLRLCRRHPCRTRNLMRRCAVLRLSPGVMAPRCLSQGRCIWPDKSAAAGSGTETSSCSEHHGRPEPGDR